MTFEKLKKIIKINNIPEDVTILAYPKWECDACDTDGVYYSKERNEIHLLQEYETCYKNGESVLSEYKGNRDKDPPELWKPCFDCEDNE